MGHRSPRSGFNTGPKFQLFSLTKHSYLPWIGILYPKSIGLWPASLWCGSFSACGSVPRLSCYFEVVSWPALCSFPEDGILGMLFHALSLSASQHSVAFQKMAFWACHSMLFVFLLGMIAVPAWGPLDGSGHVQNCGISKILCYAMRFGYCRASKVGAPETPNTATLKL